MASRVLVSGLPRTLPPLPPGPAPTCVPCVEGRQRAAPHSSEFPPTEAPLQTLHMDVWGPARVRGQGHERYFLLVVDDYWRYTTVFPLRSKGDVTEVLIDWIRAARLQLRESFGSDFPVLRLHSDRGGEFSSARLGAFCRAQGIRQTYTLPASPQQNGIAERRIGMVMDVASPSGTTLRSSASAMDAEMASWKSTGTYVDEVPPPGANIVSGMWIFRVKRPPGSPPVFKARYVARGFSQRQGVDYFQTFSPTPKMTTLRVLLHVAAQRDYENHSLDFSTAVLQGSLHEEIWLRRPPGFTGSFPLGTQWSLRRPVYGLRQAPREWHDTLRTALAALGFAPSTADPSLNLRTDTSLPPFYILVYVDDLVFATADTARLAHVKSELQKRHTCTDLGELRSYLGLQITRDRAQRTVTLTQSHMVQQVLHRFDFTYSSPQATPLSTRHSLSALPSDESVEPSGPCPELVGCLMYLMTCTRPDLAYPLSILARYVAPGRHRPEHMAAAKRVLRYLCSTSGLGLVLGGRRLVVLTGHAHASWADDQATQRSSQGYTFSLGSGSVSWRSTRLSSVLGSSCEAEIYAGAMAAQELRWLTYLLTDLGEPPRSPPILYVDNKAMLALCREHRVEHRTKHIALHYFLASELQQRGQLRLAYVASEANTADIFTKALPPGDHQRLCTMLASEGAAYSMPGMERNRTAPSPWEPPESRRHVEFVATSGEYAVTAPMSLKPQRPPCFDPSQRGGPTVQSWVFTMNVFFNANYVESDATKIRYTVSLLRGPAMDWWRVIVTSPRAYKPPSQEDGPTGPAVTWSSFCETAQYSTWDAWCAGLRARFEPVAASISARQKLRTWRQLGSVQDYTTGFLALYEQVGYMHEAERVDRYVGGLKPDKSHEIMLRGLSNINEILALAEKIDILRRPRPRLDGHDILLGHDWLRRYNPRINWTTGSCTVQSNGNWVELPRWQSPESSTVHVNAITMKRAVAAGVDVYAMDIAIVEEADKPSDFQKLL
ncbi:unnamed protein product [Closterium sp. NIES-54]